MRTTGRSIHAAAPRPAAISQRPAASSQQPVASSQQPVASSQQPAAHSLLLLAFIWVLAPACRVTDHSERDPKAITTEVLDEPASGYAEGDTADLPHMAFDSMALNFGRIAQGAQVERTFRFTNDGGSTLIITDVRSTCGCTVGKDWPKEPVAPGQGGTITVRFDSEGRGGLIDKAVTVTANTRPPTQVLRLIGEVVAPPGASVVE